MRFLSLFVIHQTIDTRFSRFTNGTSKIVLGAINRFRFFDFIFRKVENRCLHSHLDEKINNWETAREGSVGYDSATSSQKLITGRSLCLIFASLFSCKCINSTFSRVPTAKSSGITEKGFAMYL